MDRWVTILKESLKTSPKEKNLDDETKFFGIQRVFILNNGFSEFLKGSFVLDINIDRRGKTFNNVFLLRFSVCWRLFCHDFKYNRKI